MTHQPSLRRHRFSAAAGLDNSRVLAADARQRRNRVLRLVKIPGRRRFVYLRDWIFRFAMAA